VKENCGEEQTKGGVESLLGIVWTVMSVVRGHDAWSQRNGACGCSNISLVTIARVSTSINYIHDVRRDT